MRRLLPIALALACGGGNAMQDPARPGCDQANGGVTLPAGFCAAVFADETGVARHIAAGPGGVVYVAMEPPGRTSAGTSRSREPGGILILRDTTGDGRADARVRIPTDGGSGIALRAGWLYFSTQSTVQRYRLAPGGVGVAGPPDTVVLGIPPGGHSSRSLAFDDAGGLFVNVGSDSNVCTVRGVPSPDPCPELHTRAGIWRYSADKLRQLHPQSGEHWAIGLRNAVGLAWDSSGRKLYAASHGRDGLADRWRALYTPARSAEQPSEEFVVVGKGDDFGWPYCFHDNELGRKVLAPEYGGDGKSEGRCTAAREPVIGFPGHWGPNGVLFYGGAMFPARYRNGAFIAFHGSWNRAPRPQAGYKVVFVPRTNGALGPAYETFADDFAGGRLDPGGATYRPVGMAVGPDGALFITDDQRGRIWRITWAGSR